MCKKCDEAFGVTPLNETWFDLGQAWLLLLLTWLIVGTLMWAAFNYVSPTFGLPTLRYAEGLALFALIRLVVR